MDHSTETSERVSLSYDGEKVAAQLAQLSIEEKISLLAGSGFTTTAGIPRLDIPSLKLAEGVNGVKDAMAIDAGDTVADVLAGGGPKTVCYPSTSCFGATFNPELSYRLGQALGSQAREKDIATIMGPGVNLHRDPRCGRNFEYFSEDPYLTGLLSGAMINGIQQQGVGACAKHFVANDAEDYRRAYNVIDPTGGVALRELYLSAFQELLVHSNPVCIMTSYNKVNGIYTSETPLIEKVIRGEWGYDGAIQSDWFGTVSTAASIIAGQDLEMPGPSIFRGPRLLKALKEGQVTEEHIDRCARKMLEWIDKVTGSDRKPALSNEEAVSVAHQVASEGIVLLKNKDQALPLDLKKAPKLAIVGQPAVDPPVGGGGSSLAPPQYVLKPLDCIQAAHTQPDLVRFAAGVRCNKVLPPIPTSLITAENGKNGIDVTYYNNKSPDVPALKEFQSHGQVTMLGHIKPGLDSAGFRYELSTTLTPETTGNHTIGVHTTGAFKLFIDGSEVLSAPSPNCNAEEFLFASFKLEKSYSHPMEAGKSYSIKLVIQSWTSIKQKPNEPAPHIGRLCFQYAYSDDDAIAEAVSIASDSDISIVFAGRNSEHEGEGSDMPDIYLPGNQAAMVKAVAAVSKRTIVVLYSGGPLDVSSFVEDVDAIIHAHYLGQEGGAAIADVLSGKVNPSGKLATTWPKRLEDVGSFSHFPATQAADGTIDLHLSEGLEVGYRRDTTEVDHRYPFGFGLSYTSFQYSGLVIKPSKIENIEKNEEFSVKVNLKNTGSVAGAEAVQVYVRPIEMAVSRPKSLRGLTKVALEPGASKEVDIAIDLKKALSHWDVAKNVWKVDKGTYGISIGNAEGLESTVVVDKDYEWLGL
ncbi:hypothetical protein G7Z17_g10406 [Cylindrodendrum hubeiense]|uniref:beta-glucosidase n=1 Tax=Cylindrodendrum hubeiense TaxID=595255 RepID=A0A9P5GXR1_9HYPO|nr:hypothetical protein G7Z17_g10406 [Cylindrodendrum hubeiense]